MYQVPLMRAECQTPGVSTMDGSIQSLFSVDEHLHNESDNSPIMSCIWTFDFFLVAQSDLG